MSQLLGLRENINQINQDIINLLLERKRISIEIGKIKKEMRIPIYDPLREKSIYDYLKSKYPNDYHYLKPIFETIIQESRNSQH
tara:strand:- start:1222 stop:1473 length:252 start_codon:yes stop_codon:yes gene_type:complete